MNNLYARIVWCMEGKTRASAAAPGVGALLASFSLKPPTCAVRKVAAF